MSLPCGAQCIAVDHRCREGRALMQANGVIVLTNYGSSISKWVVGPDNPAREILRLVERRFDVSGALPFLDRLRDSTAGKLADLGMF